MAQNNTNIDRLPDPNRALKRLLVTGGAGFIGSAFIRMALQQSTCRIVNLDALTYAANPALLEGFDHRFVHGDILDTNLVKELCHQEQIDTIVHFAAQTHVDRSIFDARMFFETNVMGTLSLLEVVRAFPHIHFHHISTDEVYGSLGETGFFTEESPLEPNSPYAASKAASDHLVRSFAHTYNLSTTISHCTNNYGPGQHSEKLIPLMLSQALAREPLPVYGTGKNVRDWIYVDDHVEGIWMILNKGRRSGIYDLGGQCELSNLKLIHKLLNLLTEETGEDFLPLIRFVPDRPGHDFRYSLDCTKIQEELGWQPKTNLEKGLRQTIRWYLNNHNLSSPLR